MIRKRTGDQIPVTVIAVSAEIFPIGKRVRISVEPWRSGQSIRIGKRNIPAQYGKLPRMALPQSRNIRLCKKMARVAVRNRVPDLRRIGAQKRHGIRSDPE